CDLVQANNFIVRDLHGFHIFEVALLRTYEASLPCAAPTKDELAVSPRSNFATEERTRRFLRRLFLLCRDTGLTDACHQKQGQCGQTQADASVHWSRSFNLRSLAPASVMRRPGA